MIISRQVKVTNGCTRRKVVLQWKWEETSRNDLIEIKIYNVPYIKEIEVTRPLQVRKIGPEPSKSKWFQEFDTCYTGICNRSKTSDKEN